MLSCSLFGVALIALKENTRLRLGMDEIRQAVKRFAVVRLPLLSLFGAVACTVVAAQPDAPERALPMTIYVDPQTGAFLKEPTPGHLPLQVSPQLQNALSTSHEGLVETPSSVPGGGVKLDLKGRFQSPLIVTIDVDGKVKMQHLTEVPKPDDTK